MSNKLSDLVTLSGPTALVSSDLIYVVRGGASYKAQASALSSFIGSGYQPLNANLTALATPTLGAINPYGRELLTKGSAADVRTYIGAVIGTNVQAWDADLDALAMLAGAIGMVARTAAGTATARTITGTAGQITLTNGDGVAGNPTISLPATITQAETFSALLTASAGIAASGGDISLVRTDAAASVITARGLTGQQQTFEMSVSTNQRWALYRDNSNVCHLYEDNSGIAPFTAGGNRLSLQPGGRATFAKELGIGIIPATGQGAIQLSTASTDGILFGDIAVTREAANTIQVAAQLRATAGIEAVGSLVSGGADRLTLDYSSGNRILSWGPSSGVNGALTIASVTSTGATLYAGVGLFVTGTEIDVVFGYHVIPTNATNGFAYIPACAGTPTGVPTTYAGRIPLVVDSTNHKLYFYSGGAWRDAGP